jgi:hypothetical protein
MKFVEGFIVGGVVGTSIWLMYSDNSNMWNTKKMIKRGKQLVKKMGMH